MTAVEMATPGGAVRLAAALAAAHVALLAKLRHHVPVDALIVGYPGHFMVPLGRGASALMHTRLVFDPLVSLSDTFTADRGLVAAGGWKARAVRAVDRAAFALPDLVLADTRAHATYYRSAFHLPDRRLAVVPVGALPVPTADGSARSLQVGEPLRVFQYGKWSPLHGADTVVEAACLLRDESFRFVLAGEGQLSASLRSLIASRRLTNVEWLGSLAPAALRAETLAADVCLGVFGRSEKAARVVPNKVYDALSCGRPVVTADTLGARELLTDGADAALVPAADAESLAEALRGLLVVEERARLGEGALALYRRTLTPRAVAGALLAALEEL
jgi:glycosyltransferase involved in cell wall biosynthesis